MNDKPDTVLSTTCGVQGCNLPTDINIYSKGVTRCAKHFSQDLDDFKQGRRTPRIAGRFNAQKDIMDSLAEQGLVQGDNESLKEFGQRCKKHTLETQGNMLPASLRG